jgi:hypothetical protein
MKRQTRRKLMTKTTEEGESSVNTLTGTECNTIYETDEEEFEDKLVSTAGECSVNTLTGTACNTIYETGEEGLPEIPEMSRLSRCSTSTTVGKRRKSHPRRGKTRDTS